jgi:drug/metabolite transporter (DMT)-like permease
MDISVGIFFGIVSMLSWGCSDFFIAKSARKVDPFKAFLWSQLIALALMTPIFFTIFEVPAFTPVIICLILASGVLTVIANWSFYKALRIGKVAIVMPVESCWAVVTVLLSIALLGEMLTILQAAGVILALSGVVLVSFKWKDMLRLKNHAIGVNYAVVAAIAYGADFVLIDMMTKEIGWFLPILLIGTVTGIFLLLYSRIEKKDISFPKGAVVFIALVGILDTVAYLAYSLGLTSEYGSIIAPIGAASPAVSVILAKIFFGERIHFNQKIGVVFALMGLLILSS